MLWLFFLRPNQIKATAGCCIKHVSGDGILVSFLWTCRLQNLKSFCLCYQFAPLCRFLEKKKLRARVSPLKSLRMVKYIWCGIWDVSERVKGFSCGTSKGNLNRLMAQARISRHCTKLKKIFPSLTSENHLLWLFQLPSVEVFIFDHRRSQLLACV